MRNQVSIAVTIALVVFSILGLVIGDSVNSISSAATQSYCTVVAESSMTVHLVDESGKPIPNATILLNGTFSCQPAPPDSRLNQSGITDSNGNAWFVVIPYANYNVTVILPENLQSRTIILTRITAPMPTFSTTIDVACTPSADRCTIGPPKSETQTTSITTAPIDWLDFPAILIAILIGLFIVVKKKGRR